jgi:hypothetical protein
MNSHPVIIRKMRGGLVLVNIIICFASSLSLAQKKLVRMKKHL